MEIISTWWPNREIVSSVCSQVCKKITIDGIIFLTAFVLCDDDLINGWQFWDKNKSGYLKWRNGRVEDSCQTLDFCQILYAESVHQV
jgi:hypothetical protein